MCLHARAPIRLNVLSLIDVLSDSFNLIRYSEEDVANIQRLLAHYKNEADSKENSQRELYEQVTSLKRTVAKLEGEVGID